MSARRVVLPIGLALLASACRDAGEARRDTAVTDAATGSVELAAARPADLAPRFRTIGRTATPAEQRAWNIHVNPEGRGLPEGRGTYEHGARVFAAQCAACHGPKGEGIAPNPRLIGPEPRDFSFGKDPALVKTVGNYWPYATTLYDYINRAMPFTAPGSLPPDDVYSVIAFLLAENGVVDRGATMDARSLPRVVMPGRSHFVPDNRAGSKVVR